MGTSIHSKGPDRLVAFLQQRTRRWLGFERGSAQWPSPPRARPARRPPPGVQQPLSAVCSLGLVPWACCAAVGWPCICLCTSGEEIATSSAARFIVLVGGSSLRSVPAPCGVRLVT